MTVPSQEFPYAPGDPALGAAGARPQLPITLEYRGNTAAVQGLVDSGAALNVLRYDVGVRLGAVWAQETIPIQLTGNLASFEARAIVLQGTVASFPPVRLAFAWTTNNQVPVLLGQANFFMEFDVCFFRSRLQFEVTPSSQPNP